MSLHVQQIGIRALVHCKLLPERILKMSMVRLKVEKFDGTNDFGLYRIKMKVLLVQHSHEWALEGETALASTMSNEEKISITMKALIMI